MGFHDYCSNTTLAGWSYLPTEKGFGKVYWAGVIIISFVAAFYFVFINTKDFRESTVITVLETPSEPLTG